MKIILYSFCGFCLIGSGLNIWCIVTHQPSTLHLNGLASVMCLISALVCFICGKLAD